MIREDYSAFICVLFNETTTFWQFIIRQILREISEINVFDCFLLAHYGFYVIVINMIADNLILSGQSVRNRGTIMVETISREILSGKLRNGHRLLSIRDLAGEYNVSFGVARAAIGQLAEMGLIQKSRGSGTYVSYAADSINRMNAVYLMLNSKEHLYDHLAADLVSSLHENGAQAVKVSWNRNTGIEQFSDMFKWWRQEPPKAVVTQWENPEIDDAIMNFCDKDTRIIATFRLPAGLPDGWSSVTSDWGQAIRIAISHLLRLGHRRFGLVQPEIVRHKGNEKYLTVNARLDQRRMMHLANETIRNSQEADQCTVCTHYNKPLLDNDLCNPFTKLNLSRVKQWLSREDRPTAVIGQDSRMVAVKRVSEQMGLRIPDDISLIGLGNTPWAEAGDLTSMWMHEDIIAQRIGELIYDDDESFFNTARHLAVTPELVLRSSDGVCRSSVV